MVQIKRRQYSTRIPKVKQKTIVNSECIVDKQKYRYQNESINEIGSNNSKDVNNYNTES